MDHHAFDHGGSIHKIRLWRRKQLCEAGLPLVRSNYRTSTAFGEHVKVRSFDELLERPRNIL